MLKISSQQADDGYGNHTTEMSFLVAIETAYNRTEKQGKTCDLKKSKAL